MYYRAAIRRRIVYTLLPNIKSSAPTFRLDVSGTDIGIFSSIPIDARPAFKLAEANAISALTLCGRPFHNCVSRLCTPVRVPGGMQRKWF